jgi:LmbE family N-acetylglucosaminyl deacetylase
MNATDVYLIEPHADDFMISMCVAAAHYAGNAIKVNVVTMTSGGSGGVLDDLDGSAVCGWHGYHHNPAVEGYTAPAEADFANLRLAESHAALGSLVGYVASNVGCEHLHGGLTDGFGSLPDGVSQAQAVIKQLVDTYANGTTFFHTMSPTADDHPDHRACGQALRNLKNDPAYSSIVSGSRFFTTRLKWGSAEATAEGLSTFPFAASRKAEFDRAIRIGAKAYAAWQPPQALGVGYHQVINQFYQNGLDSQGNGTATNSVVIENKWHD